MLLKLNLVIIHIYYLKKNVNYYFESKTVDKLIIKLLNFLITSYKNFYYAQKL